MSIALRKLENAHDGSHLIATLDGQAVGTLSFWCARTPETPRAARRLAPFTAVAGQQGQPATYRLAMPVPGGWYVWARDGATDCRDPKAQFCGVSDDSLLEETGKWLRDTLSGHKPLFNATIAAKHPAPSPTVPGAALKPVPTIQQVLFGVASLTREWPAIIVDDPELTEPYVGSDNLRLVTVRLRISCMWVHADHLNQLLPTMATLGRRVQETLNLFEYNRITLPSGIRLSNCQAPEITMTEVPIEGAGWGAEASVTWSGETTRQAGV